MEIFGEDVSAPVSYSATKNKFKVREDEEKPSDKKGDLFHLFVSNLFFIMKGSRPDLETAVSFLMNRV